MAIEKERKFLLLEDKLDIPLEKWFDVSIKQGYLMLSSGKQLRVRLEIGTWRENASICYKSRVNSDTRMEYEYNIPYTEGVELYESAEHKLEKRRYARKYEGYRIDIDVYPNGIKVVEVEYENEMPELPEYCGEEVTNNKQYSNIHIAKKNGV